MHSRRTRSSARSAAPTIAVALGLLALSACGSDPADSSSAPEEPGGATSSLSPAGSGDESAEGSDRSGRSGRSGGEGSDGGSGSGQETDEGSKPGPGAEVVDGEIVDAGPDGPGMPTQGPEKQQKSVLAALDGSAKERCVDVAGLRDARSGGFAAGPFDTAREEFTGRYGDGSSVQLYFVPAHAARMPGVSVTGVHRASGERVRVRQGDSADAEQFLFYDVRLDLPRGGTWELRAVAGPDRGCWVVELP